MKIAFASSEVTPFSKTGGLADVSSALPRALSQLGNDVLVITPMYRCVEDYLENTNQQVQSLGTIAVPISDRFERATLFELYVSDLRVIFVGKDRYYNRKYLYTTPSGDYEDNAERFIFFSRAILEILKKIDFKADIIHTNDWQCGLTNTYLKVRYRDDPFFTKTRAVFTIHNIAYQGLFWHWDMHLTGLGWEEFVPNRLEFHSKINLLKAGIVYSDMITTVSENYAHEIQTPKYGFGLENVLFSNSRRLYGIINGADYSTWNPETDKFIEKTYNVEDLKGKRVCKRALQQKLNLPAAEGLPIVAIITRLTEQKGIDIILEAFESIMQLNVQFIILASGKESLEKKLEAVGSKHKKNLKIVIDFNEELAHQIEAGADIYLMPSHYEPCGLNQLYSLKYGTVPVVRKTGGLADTIIDFSTAGLNSGKSVGFTFDEYTAQALYQSIFRAIKLYENDKVRWEKLMKNGMRQDWSWFNSATKYVKMYRKVLKN